MKLLGQDLLLPGVDHRGDRYGPKVVAEEAEPLLSEDRVGPNHPG